MLTRAQLKFVASLRQKQERETSRCFLAEGVRLCEEAVASGWPIRFLLFQNDSADSPRVRALLDEARRRGIACHPVPARDMEKLATTTHTQGVLMVMEQRRKELSELRFGERPLVVALDGVRDPGNVGTIIRSADWFGAELVVLGSGCADLFNPKTVRSTMGSLFRVPIITEASLPDLLLRFRAQGFTSFAASPDGAPWWEEWIRAERRLLLLGSEAEGISPSLLEAVDARVSVPRIGGGESLNVAIAAGVLLAVARKR